MKTVSLFKKASASIMLAAVIFTSCKKADLPSSPSGNMSPAVQKEFSVFLSDAPADLQHVFIDIQKVEIKELTSAEISLGDNSLLNDVNADDNVQTTDEFGTWRTIPFASQQIDVLALRNGNESLLGTALVRNTVSKVRITLGANSYAIDNQGNQKPLLLDLSNDQIYYINLTSDDIDEDPSTNKKEARIDFDLFKSISDNNGVLSLLPALRPFSISGYGEINGTVNPIDASATITVSDQEGIVAKTIAGPNGEFRIRGLKPGVAYSVTFEAETYITQTVQNVVTEKGKFTPIDPIVLIH
jgi:hypothetical protein